jgi:molecular chaperone DnaJ
LYKQAILGDKIEIETVHGKVKLKNPEGTQSGTIFKLRIKGLLSFMTRKWRSIY